MQRSAKAGGTPAGGTSAADDDDGAGGAIAFGFCQAEDADGERAFCNTDNEDLLDAIEASADYGYVTFTWDEKTGQCTRIGFSNQSFYVPPKVGSNL